MKHTPYELAQELKTASDRELAEIEALLYHNVIDHISEDRADDRHFMNHLIANTDYGTANSYKRIRCERERTSVMKNQINIQSWGESSDVNRMVTLSTGHLTEKTRNRLHTIENDVSSIAVYDKVLFSDSTPIGYFVYLFPNELDKENPSNVLPSDLQDCIEYACSMNCNMICFDSDAAPTQNLPYYELPTLEG